MEDDPDPLIAVEPEARRESGLEELIGQEEGEGEDAAGEEGPFVEGEPEGALEETLAEEEAPRNDDMFDEEPTFAGRHFMRPRVQLPLGEAPINPGSSGVVAIFCPEEFTDDNKIEECAGRPEIRSGWRPGDSGEDWARATELLQRSREAGRTGPDLDKVIGVEAARRFDDARRIRDLRDPARSQGGVNNLTDAGDDNIMRGVEGDRPAIGPAPFEPGWTFRDDSELTQEEIEELRRQLEEAEANR